MSGFGLARDGRWRLVDPDGAPFLSIGITHAHDTNLRYPHNLAVFRDRYGGSRRRWIAEGLVGELRAWGFTTIGWTSEYVSGSGLAVHEGVVDLGHSDELPAEELAAAGMPFTRSLRVAEVEHWNGHPAYRDPRSAAFAQWCDHLARTTCRPDDPLLLGYFLVDVPVWRAHAAGGGFAARELEEVAEAYYRTAAEAIRRHDPHALVLGDRFGTRVGVPDVVLEAAARHTDVLSVQLFPGVDRGRAEAMLATVERWHERTGLPVLVCDTGNWCPTRMSPDRTGSARDQAERGRGYAMLAEAFLDRPWILGWHWCSWLENPHRGFGLKDPWDEPYGEMVERVAEANRRAAGRFARETA
ncbi:hypothetical protein [Conexibacter sp. SYSU D00693]|uniref:hypothetical protein n=1 Tax=Conexibacter sp. SYSU D00693 TaxID=2812560 RepID=UPI00196B2BBF|nr:hypothetical protein [Conexibacter sp. SYSU D00693]